jgi:hypothetical protein
MIVALKSIVGCEILGSKETFKQFVLNMFFPKACQYATLIDEKSL